MRYAAIKNNDVVDGLGICVSYWSQGCPNHCIGCHNQGTWDFNGGILDSLLNVVSLIDKAMSLNGIHRNFSILGGEPLCLQNLFYTNYLIDWCRKLYPNAKIFLWTGYIYLNMSLTQKIVVNKSDILIDGPYIQLLRDISLYLRGSSNQRIIDINKTKQNNKTVLYSKE